MLLDGLGIGSVNAHSNEDLQFAYSLVHVAMCVVNPLNQKVCWVLEDILCERFI